MPAMPPALLGLTVLIVEDNFLVAEAVRELFEECGCVVIGPASRLADGLRLARDTALHGAILDINLAGEFCFPLAVLLRARGVPFLFLSGYGEATLIPPEFRDVLQLSKPFDGLEVAEAAARRFAPGQGTSSNGAGPPSSNS